MQTSANLEPTKPLPPMPPPKKASQEIPGDGSRHAESPPQEDFERKPGHELDPDSDIWNLNLDDFSSGSSQTTSLAGSVWGEDTDEDDPGKPLRLGMLPVGTTMEHFYSSRKRLAYFYGWSEHELAELLVENEQVDAIWEDLHTNHYGKPREEAVADGESDAKRAISLDSLLPILEFDERHDFQRYIDPVQDDWGSNEWLAFGLWRFRNQCYRHGIIDKSKVSKENGWKWAYMFMKAKQILETEPGKKQKAESAHQARKDAAAARAEKEKNKVIAKKKANELAHDGIVYPSRQEYHAMTKAAKLASTLGINTARVGKNLSKWTPSWDDIGTPIVDWERETEAPEHSAEPVESGLSKTSAGKKRKAGDMDPE